MGAAGSDEPSSGEASSDATAETAETAGAVALLDPPSGKVRIPFTVGVTLAVCVLFTIFAGVSSPVIDFAKQATMFF